MEPGWEGISARMWCESETVMDTSRLPCYVFLILYVEVDTERWSGHLHIVRRVHDQDRAFYSGQPNEKTLGLRQLKKRER